MAEDIQREAHHLLHERQMGSRKGRSAQDALTRLLAWLEHAKSTRKRITAGFFDVKGGFQNIRWQGISHLETIEALWRWTPWIRRFCASRQLTLSWDGRDRGMATVSKGIPQGSPLSPILFLAYIAPMVRELEMDLSMDLGLRV